MECPDTNKTSLSPPQNPERLGDHHRRRDGKIVRARGQEDQTKQGLVAITGLLHPGTHSSCGGLHKICMRTSQPPF